MARMSDDDMETLRTVAAFGEALTYAELGAILPEGVGLRSERRRNIGVRRCRPLIEGGAVTLSGLHKLTITEKGRIALALLLGKQSMRHARAEHAPDMRN